MLDFSEDQAKRNIQALRDADVDPSDVIFGYLAAADLQDGEPVEHACLSQGRTVCAPGRSGVPVPGEAAWVVR